MMKLLSRHGFVASEINWFRFRNEEQLFSVRTKQDQNYKYMRIMVVDFHSIIIPL